MGAGFGRLLGLFFSNKEFRVLMVGLDAAGKTTILYKLHLGEVVTTIPTIGFNVERVKYKNVSFTVWDVGGQQKIRPLWRHYYEGSDAIIFVIDSNDRERFDEASEELKHLLMQDTLKEAAILILANKQDLPNAVTAAQISEKVSLPKTRMWHVQPCCAPTGEGLFQGLDWLAAILAKKK